MLNEVIVCMLARASFRFVSGSSLFGFFGDSGLGIEASSIIIKTLSAASISRRAQDRILDVDIRLSWHARRRKTIQFFTAGNDMST